MAAPVLTPEGSSERFDADRLRRTVVAFRDAVRVHAPRINRLNVYPVPDGDTGTNMARTLDAVVAELDQAAPEIESTCQAISHGSLMGARGNSGVILSQILRGLAGRLSATASNTATEVAEALSDASSAAYQAVVKPIEGTILTVVREASEAAKATAARGDGLAAVLRAARDAGRAALDRTPEMLPVLKDAGVVDAGGAGFLLLLDAALNVVDGEPMPTPEDSIGGDAIDTPLPVMVAPDQHEPGSVADLRYEVMYFLHLADDKISEFKSDWAEIGDSIVVVGGDGLWNCHVHTNDIGAAIEVAIDLGGRPKQIRVTDLFREVAEHHAALDAKHAIVGLPSVTTAVVAVCSGNGLEDLFSQLGVQGIVTGGQTLNPSTAELLEAVDHVNAEQVIVLPNNTHIIPVAEQLDALSNKRVRVVPTRSMPEALAALVVYDPEADVDANLANMTDATSAMATGEITRAVRDSSSDAGPIREGDWIGIERGDGIVAVAGSPDGAAIALLAHLVTLDREIVTMIEGVDATASVTEALLAWLANERPDV
ncbi:MAG: DAK2 domain-containing protein, partial [Actinomycetota bacterium]